MHCSGYVLLKIYCYIQIYLWWILWHWETLFFYQTSFFKVSVNCVVVFVIDVYAFKFLTIYFSPRNFVYDIGNSVLARSEALSSGRAESGGEVSIDMDSMRHQQQSLIQQVRGHSHLWVGPLVVSVLRVPFQQQGRNSYSCYT